MPFKTLPRGLFRAAIVAIFVATGVRAEVPKLGSHGSWGVFRDGKGAERLCWVATEATLSSLSLDEDGAVERGRRILIMFTPSLNQLALELRGAPEPSGVSHIAVGEVRIGLFFENGWGWSSDSQADERLRSAMVTHRTGFVNLAGAGYEFSLEGFVPALQDAEEACR